MDLKEEKSKKNAYFSLSNEDRLNFELENQEKEAKDLAAKKVFEKLDKNK